MRIKTILTFAASLAMLGAAACGSDKATPLETVQNASSETAGAKTAAIAMTTRGGSGSAGNLEATGFYDFDKKLMSFDIDASKLGVPGASGKVQAIMDFSDSVVQYMKFPGLEEETGKSWLKVDIAEGLASICPDLDFAALLQAQSGDPTTGLQTLESAKSVTEVGKEEIRGEETTHYRVTVDVREVAENAPADARATLREFAKSYIDPIQTTDVWIDGKGRARKSEAVTDSANLNLPDCLKAGAEANPFKGKTTVTFELFDFGKEVDIRVPAANDVLDLADLQE